MSDDEERGVTFRPGSGSVSHAGLTQAPAARQPGPGRPQPEPSRSAPLATAAVVARAQAAIRQSHQASGRPAGTGVPVELVDEQLPMSTRQAVDTVETGHDLESEPEPELGPEPEPSDRCEPASDSAANTDSQGWSDEVEAAPDGTAGSPPAAVLAAYLPASRTRPTAAAPGEDLHPDHQASGEDEPVSGDAPTRAAPPSGGDSVESAPDSTGVVERRPVIARTSEPAAPAPWRGWDPEFVSRGLVPPDPVRATTGWRRLFGLPAGKAEQQRRRLQAEMSVNFGQPVRVVSANPRGSAGKTTTTLNLAGALGRARGGRVCAFEQHELRGVMALLTVDHGTSLTTRDFINDLPQFADTLVRHADLTRYLRHQTAGNFDAMVTSRNAEKQLDGREYRAAMQVLERFYEVVVIDTANNEAHDAFKAALEDATVLVVPTKWRRTHIDPAVQMLHDLSKVSARHEILVRNAVIVATNGFNEAAPGVREKAKPVFESLAADVVEVPADPHIAEDGPILFDQLSPATRLQLDKLGAAVCGAAVRNIREMNNL